MLSIRWTQKSGSFAGRWLQAGLLSLASTAVLPAGTPDFDGARQFGYELQQDYLQRRAPALLDRLDGEAMRRRTFGSLGSAALQSERAKREWTETLLPTITQDLMALGKFSNISPDRVLLLEGHRMLECSMVDETGQFQILMLVLDQNAAGRVSIVDYRLLGMETFLTRRLRHLYILLGAPFHPAMDGEEKSLSLHGEGSSMAAVYALTALGQGKAEEAFRHWSNLPSSVHGFPIWREFRDRMAAAGSEKARAQQLADLRAGRQLQPLVRLGLANMRRDSEAALKALDAMLDEHHQSPFLRTLKAGALLQSGRAPRALALAEEVYRLHPFNASAYLIAIQAAVAMGRVPTAMTALNECHRVLPAEAIEGMLVALEPLAEFRKTPEYLEWKQRAAAVTAPVVPPPAR